MENKKLSDWKDLAEKELRGKKLDTLNVKTCLLYTSDAADE